MQPVYRCDYCNRKGSKAEIKKTRARLRFNKARRTCHTCCYREGWTFFKCKNGKDLPEKSYMQNCDAWADDVKEDDPFSIYLDSFFGQTREEKEKQNAKS